ncbi:HGxxPAAW family protein [Streptomyces sp. NPDC001508]|uniref:HGxxPAAW family protein n=1 Tax=Streptomyces sp. NPDC001508 TaxID=3154656 RepID=UPI00332CCA12
MSGHLHDEGHTVAGWAGACIATVGATVAGLGVVMTSVALAGVGVGIVVVAVLVTWLLHLVGWGKAPGPRSRAAWGLRVRDAGARDGHPGCVACRLAGRGRHTAMTAAVTATAAAVTTGPDPEDPRSAVAETGN